MVSAIEMFPAALSLRAIRAMTIGRLTRSQKATWVIMARHDDLLHAGESTVALARVAQNVAATTAVVEVTSVTMTEVTPKPMRRTMVAKSNFDADRSALRIEIQWTRDVPW
jgi:hypothetical protein